jgi:hypothetical protein
MKIKDVLKKYRNQWVLAEVLLENKAGQPTQVKVLAHSRSRGTTYSAMRKVKARYSYHFYAGEIPPKGYAIAFYVKSHVQF